jgi:hypothetical protein
MSVAAAAEPQKDARPDPGGVLAVPRAIARYVGERVNDLLDVFEVNVGIGRGAKIDVKYGVQFLGLGDVRSRRLGTIDRRVGYWRENDSEIGLLPLSLLAWPVHYGARELGARRLAADAKFVAETGSDGLQLLDRKELNDDPEFLLKDTVNGPVHARWGDSFPIGAEVHVGVGVRVMLRPLQLLDFIAGFAGIELDPWLAECPSR